MRTLRRSEEEEEGCSAALLSSSLKDGFCGLHSDKFIRSPTFSFGQKRGMMEEVKQQRRFLSQIFCAKKERRLGG